MMDAVLICRAHCCAAVLQLKCISMLGQHSMGYMCLSGVLGRLVLEWYYILWDIHRCDAVLQLECISTLGQHSVGWVCLFGVLGLLVTSAVRVTADLGTGLINGVIYGITVVIALIPGRPPHTAYAIWAQVLPTPAQSVLQPILLMSTIVCSL